jgi:hypothetical protein
MLNTLARRYALAPLLCLTLSLSVQAGDAHREHAAHVHGEGTLTLALDDGTLEVNLVLPADSAFGFEHTPQTPEEKAIVAKVAALLDNLGAWLAPAAGHCIPRQISLSNPYAGETPAQGHADIDLTATLACKDLSSPAAFDVNLFTALPKLKHLEAEYVTASGAGEAELSPSATRLTLK